jgi:hypothetical protein
LRDLDQREKRMTHTAFVGRTLQSSTVPSK